MKSRAAVAFAAGKPLQIVEIDVAPPQAGEVLVKITHTGVCHTDAFTLSGDDPEGLFPAVLGHEGAGIVVEVGDGVTSVKPGDHVIPLYTAECRRVPVLQVRQDQPVRGGARDAGQGRDAGRHARASRTTASRSTTTWAASTFSEYTVVPEISLAKINPATPTRAGLPAGLRRHHRHRRGAQHREGAGRRQRRGVRPRRHRPGGDPGRACRRRPGASSPSTPTRRKFELARQMGATDCVNPKDHDKPIQQVHRRDDRLGRGPFSFECIGNVHVMRAALECCAPRLGRSR